MSLMTVRSRSKSQVMSPTLHELSASTVHPLERSFIEIQMMNIKKLKNRNGRPMTKEKVYVRCKLRASTILLALRMVINFTGCLSLKDTANEITLFPSLKMFRIVFTQTYPPPLQAILKVFDQANLKVPSRATQVHAGTTLKVPDRAIPKVHAGAMQQIASTQQAFHPERTSFSGKEFSKRGKILIFQI